MAKKRTKRKTSRKRLDGKDPSKFQTGKDIVDFWEDEINKGLRGGLLEKDKTLSLDIAAKHRKRLVDYVQKRLDGTATVLGEVFKKENEQRTKRVANDLGKICRMLTTQDDEISVKTFDAAYCLVKDHHDICNGTPKDRGGFQDLRGVWCEGGGA